MLVYGRRRDGYVPESQALRQAALEASLTGAHFECACELVLAGARVTDALLAQCTAWGRRQRQGRGRVGEGGEKIGALASEGGVGEREEGRVERGGEGGLGAELWGLWERGEAADVTLVLPCGTQFKAHKVSWLHSISCISVVAVSC